MMTRAERTAMACVNVMWKDLVEGTFAGPNFTMHTYDIEGFVEIQCLASYAGTPPKVAVDKAKKLARKLWNERIEETMKTPSDIVASLNSDELEACLVDIDSLHQTAVVGENRPLRILTQRFSDETPLESHQCFSMAEKVVLEEAACRWRNRWRNLRNSLHDAFEEEIRAHEERYGES